MADNGISPSSKVNVAVEAKDKKAAPGAAAASTNKQNAGIITLGGPNEGGSGHGKAPVTMSERKELQESLKQTLTEFKQSQQNVENVQGATG